MKDNINAVIEKAKNDPVFSDMLKEKANKAAATQFGSTEWDEYLDLFAMGPGELGKITRASATAAKDGPMKTTTATTATTLATTTTAACTGTTTTTTTTTTSNYCP